MGRPGEVTRGPGVLRYGSQAIGGVVSANSSYSGFHSAQPYQFRRARRLQQREQRPRRRGAVGAEAQAQYDIGAWRGGVWGVEVQYDFVDARSMMAPSCRRSRRTGSAAVCITAPPIGMVECICCTLSHRIA